jgi:transcription antitermination factor NusG
MPRIPKETAEAIKNGEVERGGNRKAIQGYVLVRMIEATETEEKESGYAGQDLKFEVVAPKEHKGTWVWDFISYGDSSRWKWLALFDAFGFEADSDTDEIVDAGEDESDPAYAVLDCSIQVQTKGKNKGKEKTQVEDYMDATNQENLDLVGE